MARGTAPHPRPAASINSEAKPLRFREFRCARECGAVVSLTEFDALPGADSAIITLQKEWPGGVGAPRAVSHKGVSSVTTPDCTLSARDRAILGMTAADILRFWSKVDKTPGHGPKGECWVWAGRRDRAGYGRFDGRTTDALPHRVSYFLATGVLPPTEKPHVLHECDNRACVNPDHLWVGTQEDNNKDMHGKGRYATGDRSGSRRYPERMARYGNTTRFSPENTRGEKSANAKLTEEDVRNILSALAEGGVRKGELARRFRVSTGAIRFIERGVNWRHIPRPAHAGQARRHPQ